MDKNVLSLDHIRSSLCPSKLLRSTMYEDKKRKLGQRNSERLDRLELRVLAVLSAVEFPSQTSRLAPYYECNTHTFEEGQIQAYFNQSVGRFTLLDFVLFDPTGGGLEDDLTSGLIRFPIKFDNPTKPERPRRVAARSGLQPMPSEVVKRVCSKIKSKTFIKLDTELAKMVELQKSQHFCSARDDIVFKGLQTKSVPTASSLVELCIKASNTFGDQSAYESIIRTAFSGNSRYVDRVPDWSFLRFSSSQKEIENEFARKLLVGEMLSHISARIDLEGSVCGVPIAKRVRARPEERRQIVYKTFLLKKVERLLSVLNYSNAEPDIISQYNNFHRQEYLLADDTIVHLARSTIILCFARQLHQDLDVPVFTKKSMSRADVLFDGFRKKRLSTFYLFVNQFKKLSETENLWLQKEDVIHAASKAHVGQECRTGSLESLSSFGSICMAVCGSLSDEIHSIEDSIETREESLNRLLATGREVLGLAP